MKYTAIGHVSIDAVDGSTRLGGTVAYSAMQAVGLGWEAEVITQGREQDLRREWRRGAPEIDLRCSDAPDTTSMSNLDIDLERRQLVHSWAGPMPLTGLERFGDVLHLGPIAREFGVDAVLPPTSGTFLGVTPQGLTRAWNDDGAVRQVALSSEQVAILARADAVILSRAEEDACSTLIGSVSASGGTVVVTDGGRGCEVFDGERWLVYETTKARIVVDDVGAGDAFAATFFVWRAEGQGIRQSIEAASVAGGLSVTRRGIRGLGDRNEIEAVLASGPQGRFGEGRRASAPSTVD